MKFIPKQYAENQTRIKPNNITESCTKNEKVLFSFASVNKNQYFNLDGTCQNWASDLFDIMQQVSRINVKDIYAGRYSGRNSTLRIHRHGNAKPPCNVPDTVSLDDMWQIRISLSKGGIHGVFSENIFYVIWFDPHHNLYPDPNHGGLKRVIPPSTCCKDRDIEIGDLRKQVDELREERDFWLSYAQEKEQEMA